MRFRARETLQNGSRNSEQTEQTVSEQITSTLHDVLMDKHQRNHSTGVSKDYNIYQMLSLLIERQWGHLAVFDRYRCR